MRRIAVALAVGVMLALGVAMPASAHVHGITPLRCVSANANAGAARADDVSPVIPDSGLIPSVLGNAPLTVGDGGFDAAPCD